MTEHTPGPWQVKGDYLSDCLTIIAGVDGEIIDGTTHYTYSHIAICVDEFGEVVLDAVANARAIAALPDLTKAMVEACDLLAERTFGSPARSPGHNARVVLESALRKAGITKATSAA